MVILEAAAARLPFAASAIGGIPDLIANDESGLLFDPKVSDSIRNCVLSMIQKPELAERVSRQAHEQAMKSYAADVVAEQHARVYSEIISTRRT